jgi:phospholipid N-methyltransferase
MLNKKKEICIIFEDMSFPPVKGGHKAIYYKLISLTRYYNVNIITSSMNYKPEDKASVDSYKYFKSKMKRVIKYKRNITKITESNLKSKFKFFTKWIVSPDPYNALIHKSSRNIEKVTDFITKNNIQLVMLEGPYVSSLIKFDELNRNKIKWVLIEHNLEDKFFKEAHKKYPFLGLIVNYEIYKIKRFEKRLYQEINGIICLSPYDKFYLSEIKKIKMVYHAPIPLNKSDNKWKGNYSSKDIIFIGPLTFYPNLEGFEWFYKNVFKEFRANNPEYTLKITGNIPEEIKTKYCQEKGVEFLGFVPEKKIRNLVSNSRYGVIPIRKGSGVKVKLLELISIGLPTIVSSEVAEGVSYKKNTMPFLISKNKQEFLLNMERFSSETTLLKKISRNARCLFEKEHVIKNSILVWTNILEKIMNKNDKKTLHKP